MSKQYVPVGYDEDGNPVMDWVDDNVINDIVDTGPGTSQEEIDRAVADALGMTYEDYLNWAKNDGKDLTGDGGDTSSIYSLTGGSKTNKVSGSNTDDIAALNGGTGVKAILNGDPNATGALTIGGDPGLKVGGSGTDLQVRIGGNAGDSLTVGGKGVDGMGGGTGLTVTDNSGRTTSSNGTTTDSNTIVSGGGSITTKTGDNGVTTGTKTDTTKNTSNDTSGMSLKDMLGLGGLIASLVGAATKTPDALRSISDLRSMTAGSNWPTGALSAVDALKAGNQLDRVYAADMKDPIVPGKRFAEGGEVEGALSQTVPLVGAVTGKGGGQDDMVPAQLSPGEYVFDAETVAMLGDGDNAAGARKLDELRQKLRAEKRSAPADQIAPPAKGALSYIGG